MPSEAASIPANRATEPIERLLRDLRTRRTGLSGSEVERRRRVYGPNEIVRHTRRIWPRQLGRQLILPLHTELGRIAALSQRTGRDPSPLERQILHLAWVIAAVALIVAAAFLLIGAFIAHLPFSDAVTFSIGLLVANVPEGLLPTLTLALALAVRLLARSNALIKRLSAVETLGGASVIFTDKTKTITENRMTMTFLGIVACQIGTAFAARTERVSLLRIDVLGNRLLLRGIAFEIALAALVVYAPPPRIVFGTPPPPTELLLLLLPMPVIVWGVDELYRWLVRAHGSGRARGQPAPTPRQIAREQGR